MSLPSTFIVMMINRFVSTVLHSSVFPHTVRLSSYFSLSISIYSSNVQLKLTTLTTRYSRKQNPSCNLQRQHLPLLYCQVLLYHAEQEAWSNLGCDDCRGESELYCYYERWGCKEVGLQICSLKPADLWGEREASEGAKNGWLWNAEWGDTCIYKIYICGLMCYERVYKWISQDIQTMWLYHSLKLLSVQALPRYLALHTMTKSPAELAHNFHTYGLLYITGESFWLLTTSTCYILYQRNSSTWSISLQTRCFHPRVNMCSKPLYSYGMVQSGMGSLPGLVFHD